MRSRIVVLALAAAVLLAHPPAASACDCSMTLLEALEKAAVVYVGQLERFKGQTSIALVRVQKVYKGKLSGTVEVYDGIPSMSCGYRVLGAPGRYLIFADRESPYGEDPGGPGVRLFTPDSCPQ